MVSFTVVDYIPGVDRVITFGADVCGGDGEKGADRNLSGLHLKD